MYDKTPLKLSDRYKPDYKNKIISQVYDENFGNIASTHNVVKQLDKHNIS